MDEISLVQICTSAFSESDILNAKNLLFDSLSSSRRKKIRKRIGKSRRDLEDIISVIKETDPEEIPVFVARELHKLPPVLFNHVDVTRLLKDIVRIDNELKVIKGQYVTTDQLMDVKSDLESLKKTSVVNNFAGNVNARRGACLLNSFNFDSGPMGLQPAQDNIMSPEHELSPPNQKLREFVPIATANNLREGNTQEPQFQTLAVNESAERAQSIRVPCTEAMTHTQPSTTSASGDCIVKKAGCQDEISTRRTSADIVRGGEWKQPAHDEKPISLATVVAKVLDSLLDQHLSRHVKLSDAQFGFQPGLSTESAILCLKQTVKYYTDRNTPVFACFLDLSKAFDLVSYRLLWKKLQCQTDVPQELVAVLRSWYERQTNCVRWASSYSDVYRLECGVRQGGLTSPRLFNLYINGLIEELSGTNVGCFIDGVCVNNISYADDMVLLSPSIGAMRKLLNVCEAYAVSHGLRYNVKKSEYMVFKAGAKSCPRATTFTLNNSPLNRVSQFKYLGHWVTEDLRDNVDIERERRALSTRCNMVARRFSRCSRQRVYSALRVQYNNGFRMLMGLPRFCSASGMFSDMHTDGFHAIVRKRVASLLKRLRGSTNSILNVMVDRWDSPLLGRWMRLHAKA
ncbi:hypothetical protein ABMA27_001691 [Loxostege sticticalis]|uniref:Reverse transcriptase domain-containing protein n=1 Tax=Loxostege sticticalis TaxID=481309 RepID=A0ABR3HZD7_LOXSC